MNILGLNAFHGDASAAHSFRDWRACAYLRAGGPFKGRASRAYAEERMVFEALLARLLAGPEPASRISS
jgi:hypothetical protein